MSSLERFSEYRGFGLERFHCTYVLKLIEMYNVKCALHHVNTVRNTTITYISWSKLSCSTV